MTSQRARSRQTAHKQPAECAKQADSSQASQAVTAVSSEQATNMSGAAHVMSATVMKRAPAQHAPVN